MLFVGIDIAKFKHDVSVIDSHGKVILKHLTFQNSSQGFQLMHDRLMELSSIHDCPIYIALEDTGHYALCLLSFLRKHYLNIYSYNPLLIKKFIEGLTLRKTKTDKKDALIIARKLLADFPQLEQAVVPDVLMSELKFATRHRNRLTRKVSDAKVQYGRVLDIAFPELDSIVNKHNQFVYTLLTKYPSTRAISKARASSLNKIKYMNSATANKIKMVAKASIGIDSKALELELVSTIKTIQYLENEIESIDQFITNLMLEIDSPIVSITGIGERLGSIILAEIRDINNFSSPEQLQAFAGLEPSINQSGESDKTGKMVKRGSPDLRWALMQAARLVAVYSPTFKKYLSKKIAEGKHYNTAISHVAKKLIRVIFYMLKNNRKFDESALI